MFEMYHSPMPTASPPVRTSTTKDVHHPPHAPAMEPPSPPPTFSSAVHLLLALGGLLVVTPTSAPSGISCRPYLAAFWCGALPWPLSYGSFGWLGMTLSSTTRRVLPRRSSATPPLTSPCGVAACPWSIMLAWTPFVACSFSVACCNLHLFPLPPPCISLPYVSLPLPCMTLLAF
jgi:hypothetical protein